MDIGFPKTILAAFVMACILTGSVQAQNANDIIQHYFDTVSNGDIKNWEKIRSVYIEAVSFYSQEEFDQSVPNFMNPARPSYVKEYRLHPYKLRRESYEDSTYRNLKSTMLWLHNKLIMRFGDMVPIIKPLKEPNAGDFDPVYLSKLLRKSKSIKYNGVKEFVTDSLSCYDIEIQTKDFAINYYFNTSSYLLEYYKVFNSSDSLNYARFYDYKNIDGLLFNMGTYGMKNGRIFHSVKIKRIQINCPIDPKKFEY